MLTEKDYCDYETCVALKELGYKESCFGHYFNAEFYIDMPPKYYQSDRYVSTPTLYEAQKWLREEKDIIVYPEMNYVGWFYTMHNYFENVHRFKYSEEYYDSYEEALSEGTKEAVKILKEK